ncbi:MAG: hypothetical protein ACPG4K_02985 [Haloferula sp.]
MVLRKLAFSRYRARANAGSERTGRGLLRSLFGRFFYSANGSDWSKCSRSFELSGYQHNALGDYSYIRPVIYYQGEGKVTVEDFNYSPYEEE